MKKLIFVCSEFKIGGVETSFNNFVRYGLSDEYNIELHVMNQEFNIIGTLPEYVRIINVKSNYKTFYQWSIVRNFKEIIQRYGLSVWLIRLIVRLLQIVGINKEVWLSHTFFPDAERTKCDVCFILKENDPCLYYALSKIEASKKIAFFHTANYFVKKYSYIYNSSLINHVVTVSEGNKSFLCEKMPNLRKKISVIHNVISPNDIRQKAKRFIDIQLDKESFCIISIGRICEEKGIRTIISTAKILQDSRLKIKWYLVGPFDKGFTQEMLMNEMHDKGISNILIALGPQRNPYPFIKQADLLVNPSLIESFGMAIREAQILGIPVIATNTYGGKELIQDGLTGLLVDIEDGKTLAEKICGLVRDSTDYDELKNNIQNSSFDEQREINRKIHNLILS